MDLKSNREISFIDGNSNYNRIISTFPDQFSKAASYLGLSYKSMVLDYDVPYYFRNKIDDLNIIIGQQQIEALDQIITVFRNKNKNDKIECIKKNNIQKSVSWCEKYKIPCNKFTEKINIFLPIISESV